MIREGGEGSRSSHLIASYLYEPNVFCFPYLRSCLVAYIMYSHTWCRWRMSARPSSSPRLGTGQKDEYVDKVASGRRAWDVNGCSKTVATPDYH